MNLTTPLLLLVVWLKCVGQKMLAMVVRVSAEEAITEIQAQSAAVKRKGLDVTLEALDYADRLDAKDEARKEVLAAYREGVMELARTTREVMKHPVGTAGVTEALAAPFFDGARNYATPTVDGPTPEALTNGTTAGMPAPPVKRKRGRPSKDENRPPRVPS